MPETRPAIALLAWVIPSPALELHRFAFENYFELGKAGGEVLWWYPCGNPRCSDPIYLELRSPELAEHDAAEIAAYEKSCQEAGGEEHYLRQLYGQRAVQRAVAMPERPLVIFETDPPLETSARLHLDRLVFETAGWRSALADALCEELTAARLKRMRQAGVFTDKSLANLQIRLNGLRHKIHRALTANDASLLAPVQPLSRPAPAMLDPELHARARFSEAKDGSLVFRVREGNNAERSVVFKPVNDKPTKQLALMKLLCMCWPQPVPFRAALGAVYDRETVSQAGANAQELAGLGEKFRALLSDIRLKKLAKASINPEILPGESPFSAEPGGLRLRLASLNDYKSQAEYDDLA